MKQQTMTILFYLNRAKTNQKGVCPLYCRITFIKKRKEFSTGQFVNPKNWKSKTQKVTLKEENSSYLNTQLSFIKQSVKNTFLKLQLQGDEFNAKDIVDVYFGRKRKEEDNVISYFNKYLVKLESLVGVDLKIATWKKYDYVKKDVFSFVKWKFNANDYPLEKLELQFVNDYEYYLKVKKKQKQITINKSIQRFKKVIKVAVAENYLKKDPFTLYKTKTVRNEVVFLSPEELKVFENYHLTQPRLQFAKDLFVFSCYTGLAYNELSRLEKKHINKGFDGQLWISMKREKTSKDFSIPILPKAASIINKHSTEELLVFSKISNQKYNSYLKEVAAIIGLEKRLTTHVARKTFASTVLLYNDVPMEIVSELLGHSSMKVTQDSYGKVVQKKVSNEIIRLSMMV